MKMRKVNKQWNSKLQTKRENRNE